MMQTISLQLCGVMTMSNLTVGTVKEMISEYSSGVYNFTINGRCSECGSCCSRYLALNNKEINTIREYIKRHNIKQQKHALFVHKDPLFDATCPFLDDTRKDHKCLIYPVRPLICREFKCDKWHEIDTNSKLYKSDLHPVDITEMFFGKG